MSVLQQSCHWQRGGYAGLAALFRTLLSKRRWIVFFGRGGHAVVGARLVVARQVG
jgi:hypothetical protein